MKRIVGVTLILFLVGAWVLSVSIGGRRIPTDAEREHVYRVAFSHPSITEKVGTVKDVSVAARKTPFFAKRRNDWERVAESDLITGTVRLLILGTKEGGVVTLTYTFRKAEDAFTVIRLDASALGSLPEPNQSPQRNAGSRPFPGDSAVSETPSLLGPRG